MDKFDDMKLGEIRELINMFGGRPSGEAVKEPSHLNKVVMIRSYGSGVHFGTLVEKNDTQAGVEVELHNSRRVHYWNGAASLSQLAMQGTKEPKDCRIACVVDELTIMGVLEIIPLTESAIKNLESVKIWEN